MLKDLLTHRRAVRRYNPALDIDDAKVRACLELAQLAPSSSNLQLYEFYHIISPDTLKEVAAACLGQSAAATAKQMVVFVTRADLYQSRAEKAYIFECQNVKNYSPAHRQADRLKNIKRYYKGLIPLIYRPHGRVLNNARQLAFSSLQKVRPTYIEVSNEDVRVSAHKSCALAAQTFMLAMAEVGYDTCPMEGFDSKRLKKLLKLPAAAEINMVVSCGVRADDGVWGDRFRLPLGDIYYTR